jgi:hypothetical protein
MRTARSLEKATTSALVLGRTKTADQQVRRSSSRQRAASMDLPQLSHQVTIGRNSRFHNLSERDREILGGIEYRSLKVLLKIVIGKTPLIECISMVLAD